MNFKYTVNPTSQVPIMLINKHIGINAKGEEGIMEDVFTRELFALKAMGKNEVDLWINSAGGNIKEGMGIYAAIKDSGMTVNTYNKGAVDSAAGWVYQAGSKRIWPSYGIGLVHEAQGGGDMDVENVNNAVAEMLAAKSTKSVDDMRALMAENKVIGRKIVEEYGLCDELVNCSDLSALHNSSDVTAVMEFGNQQIQKTLPKPIGMNKIEALLGLQNEASDDAIAASIEKLVNENSQSKTSITDLTAKLQNANTTLAETTTKLAEASAKLTELENANRKVAARAEIKEHVGKRIQNDPKIIDLWVDKMVADPEGTKALLETINLNINAPKPEPSTDTNTATVPVDVASWKESLNKN